MAFEHGVAVPPLGGIQTNAALPSKLKFFALAAVFGAGRSRFLVVAVHITRLPIAARAREQRIWHAVIHVDAKHVDLLDRVEVVAAIPWTIRVSRSFRQPDRVDVHVVRIAG